MHSRANKVLCGLLSWVLFFTWCGLPYAQGLPQARTPAEPAAVDLQKMADELETWFEALEKDRSEWPRDSFDPEALLGKTGREPQRIFEWVRDQTFLVPYSGSLRGPAGVLMDRLGNSLDRALLLCDLLKRAGHEARLARGLLTEQQAIQLLKKARPIPEGGSVPMHRTEAPPADEILERAGRIYKLDRDELRRNWQDGELKSRRLTEQMGQRLEEQLPGILSAVGSPPEDAAGQTRPAEIEALREHWWVQWRQSPEWTDLDPSLPEAQPAQTLTQAVTTLAPARIGQKLLHAVELRVVIERFDSGRLEQKQVLKHTLQPAQLRGQYVQLAHVPLEWPKDLDLFAGAEPAALKAAVLAQTDWLPVLLIGSKQVFQSSFSDTGATDSTPAIDKSAASAEKIGSTLGSMGGLLDAIPSGTDTDETVQAQKRSGVLTAAWVEYEMRVPGNPVRTIRRDLFDLLGPAARAAGNVTVPDLAEAQRLERGLSLLGTDEILVLGGQLSPEFVQDLGTAQLLARRAGLLSLLRSAETMKPQALSQKLADIQPLPAPLYALALGRQSWSRSRGDVYLDRPNVLSYRWRLRANERGELVARQGIDIVANEVAVRPGALAEPRRIRMEQGVLDTSAEGLIGLMDRQFKTVENAAEIYTASRAQGIEWLTVRNTSDPAWQQVELPADVRARIAQDLAAGYMALVPRKEVELQGRALSGWWRIDPASGHLLGMMQTGDGSEFVEYVLKGALVGIVSIRVWQSCMGSSGSGSKSIGCAVCAAITSALLILGAVGISPWWPGLGGTAACAEAGLMD